MMKRLRITVCALLVLMLLAGCAGSPSFTNMKQASSANDHAWEEEAPMMAETEAASTIVAPQTDDTQITKIPQAAMTRALPTRTTATTR